MDQVGSFQIEAEAAVALVQWKALFAEQVTMQAKELAKKSGSAGVITLDHYRQAANLAMQVLATAVQDTSCSNGHPKAA